MKIDGKHPCKNVIYPREQWRRRMALGSSQSLGLVWSFASQSMSLIATRSLFWLIGRLGSQGGGVSDFVLWNVQKRRIMITKFPETTENLSRVIYYNQIFIISSCLGDSVDKFLSTSLSRKRAQSMTSPCTLLCPIAHIQFQIKLKTMSDLCWAHTFWCPKSWR